MDQRTPQELQKHMLGTYFSLRVGMAVIAFALPIIVALTGKILHGVGLKGSLSAYYYTNGQLSFLTTRELFVGGLFAAAACLYLYKGYGTKENVALNLAGVFAALVALLPTDPPEVEGGWFSAHGAAAVLFFACIAYVSLWRARDTVGLLSPKDETRFRRYYSLTSTALVLSPVAAVVLAFLDQPDENTWTFWVETVAVWSFGAYWVVKTMEMRLSQAERDALDANLERRVVASTPGASGDARVDAAPDGGVLKAPVGARGEEKIVPAGTPGTQ